MYLKYTSNERPHPVWNNNQYPRVKWVSHSYDNPNWSYQYHVHKNETELTYIASGEGTYIINTDSYQLKAGDLVIIEKGAIHSLISSDSAPLNTWTCAISDYALCDLPEEGFMLPMNLIPHMEAGDRSELIRSLFEEMEKAQTAEKDFSDSVLDALAVSIATVFYELFRANPKTDHQKTVSFCRDILIYINENYSSRITLKQLADLFHMSSDHISHEFTKVYGISPINYVIERRISEAKWMLINTDNSLTSIARKVGYDNAAHFCNLFIKREKKTPQEFRHENRH